MKHSLNGLEIDVTDDFAVCHIEQFTNEIKKLIRKHLSNICHGKELVSKGLGLHTYKNTLREFKKRYDCKTDLIKKGMIGELLTHMLIHEFFEEFDVLSPFFNMEEKSQRKGFDLILVSKDDENVWITEVKSGEIAKTGCPNKTTKGFLQNAKRDLKKRLNQSEDTFWLNAINTVNSVVNDCNDYKDVVIKILDEEGQLALDEMADSKNNNVILTSVLFHRTNNLFDSGVPEEISKSIKKENLFNKVIAFSIQKGTYKKIESFLFKDELNG